HRRAEKTATKWSLEEERPARGTAKIIFFLNCIFPGYCENPRKKEIKDLEEKKDDVGTLVAT
ncbi:MAG TPA: hypothetical protein VHO70_18345, partial [Chitinispirillaceae bacterium]|nr:hypothetical protein [Chitinispirillaceae bacterium]